jgi:hypothetical protein
MRLEDELRRGYERPFGTGVDDDPLEPAAGGLDTLRTKLIQSQPQLLARFAASLPDKVPKVYRWVAEMQEIASIIPHFPEQTSHWIRWR